MFSTTIFEYGCNKCEQVGFRLAHTPVYQLELGQLRTGKSFFERRVSYHHQQNHWSLGINMVDLFPLDPMQLVDLGVTKRVITYILESICL